MSLHLIKLCVGVAKVETLERRVAKGDWLNVHTRNTPKRAAELEDGGSLYWVIKGVIEARQRLIGFDEGTRDDGTPCCLLLLDPAIVPVRPVPRRAFQGWRYLAAADAPPDLRGGTGDDLGAMSAKMRRELIDLGLL